MRVRRSFAFVDLCGFTSLTDVHGDEYSVGVLAEFRTIAREICSRRGVRIAKWLGDGCMLVGVETTPLVASVLEMERRMAGVTHSLALRAGLTTGDVILFEGDDYIGHSVNLAARLCDAAEPHEVLAVPELAECAPPWAKVHEVPARPIRGLVDPVPLVELSARHQSEGVVVDPVCRMELPADSVVALRSDPVDGVIGFCSESCAQAWEGRRAPQPDEGLLA